jgi:hypothetical protein
VKIGLGQKTINAQTVFHVRLRDNPFAGGRKRQYLLGAVHLLNNQVSRFSRKILLNENCLMKPEFFVVVVVVNKRTNEAQLKERRG